MRILVFELELEPFGGQELSLLEVSRELVGRGHRLDLIYARGGSFLAEYENLVETAQKVPWPSGIEPFPRVLINGLRVARRARGIDFDVMYVNSPQTLQYAWVTAAIRRKPLVTHLRFPAYYSRRWMIGVPFVTKAIVVSQATAEGYVAMGFPRERMGIVHNGVDLERYRSSGGRDEVRRRLDIDPTDFVVLYLGRIVSLKGTEVLIDAFGALLPDVPAARLLMVGSPYEASAAEGVDYLARLKQSAPRGVTWLERRSDVVPLYEAADVVVLPSLWEEPFGRTVVEAMACERPVLASNVGGLPEVLSGDEVRRFLFQPGDVMNLREKLMGLVDWRTNEPGLGKALRAYVSENFNLPIQAKKIEEHLTQAAVSKRRPDLSALRMFRRSSFTHD